MDDVFIVKLADGSRYLIDSAFMFVFSKPSEAAIESFLAKAAKARFPIAMSGRRRAKNPPRGFNVDHNRIVIGRGLEDLEKAKDAIRAWKVFDFDWVNLVHSGRAQSKKAAKLR
ncbi:MAG: DUF1990 family protein [Pyrinomonadaceae bacterium]